VRDNELNYIRMRIGLVSFKFERLIDVGFNCGKPLTSLGLA
jgi:hypothetical protein